MSFLISDAFAEAAPAAAQAPGLIYAILPFGILLAFFFLIIWPQHKKGRDQKKMVDALTKGNEVVTSGGVLGRIVDIDDNFVHLEVGEGNVIFVQKHAIASLMPKGTYKARKRTEK